MRKRLVDSPSSNAQEPVISGMANRYAAALFDLARESGAVDEVGTALDRFGALIKESPDLARLIRSPVIAAEDQERAIAALLDRAAIGGLAGNFIRLVTAKRRLFALADMIRAYRQLAAEARGVVRAQVRLAEEPSPRVMDEIRSALQEMAGAEIDLDVRIDPALIGGLVVQVGSRQIDASLRTKLNAIRTQLKEVR